MILILRALKLMSLGYLNAYEAFRCDRELNNGGGALLFIHKQLKSKPCNELKTRNPGFEDSVWRLVCLIKKNIC